MKSLITRILVISFVLFLYGTAQAAYIDNTNSAWTFVGSWRSESNALYYGGSAVWTNGVGASATVDFSGPEVYIVMLTANYTTPGVYNWSIDNDAVTGTIDNYRSIGTKRYNEILIANGLGFGSHTITFTFMGGDEAYIDAIKYLDLGPVDDLGMVFTGPWSTEVMSDYYGGTSHYTTTKDATVSANFYGTSVYWSGVVSPVGATVDWIIDEALTGTLSTYSGTFQRAGYLKLVAKGLPLGHHTVTFISPGYLEEYAEFNIDYVLGGIPPTANAGSDVTAEASEQGRAIVQLDGSGSSLGNGTGLSYEWSAPGITFADPNVVSPVASFPMGTTVVTLLVTETEVAGSLDVLSVDTDTVSVAVVDTTPPSITITRVGNVVNPQDGDTINTASITCDGVVTDLGDDNPLVEVLMYNPEQGDVILDSAGHFYDVQVTNPVWYTIRVIATDFSGKSDFAEVTVKRIHDRGGAKGSE